MGHATVERVLLFGTRSADYIRASGHRDRIAMEASLQAKTGRIHDRTRTLRRKSDLLLHRGRRPYMTHTHGLPPSIAALRKAHSITSSAIASSVGGTVRPSALAVLRFIARVNAVGC